MSKTLHTPKGRFTREADGFWTSCCQKRLKYSVNAGGGTWETGTLTIDQSYVVRRMVHWMATPRSLSATVRARSSTSKERFRKDALRELQLMSKAMIQEKGLLNHSQAALILGVTPARVTELVRLGKLSRFDFLGRTYVSVKEVNARCLKRS